MYFFNTKMWMLLFVVIFGCVQARTDEQLKGDFTKVIMKCTTDHPVEMPELMQLQKFIVPTDKATKCLLACAYRSVGTLNSKGLYDLEAAYKIAEENKNGDEKRLENGRKFADYCSKVNDVAVTDGEKGCDRSALLFGCLTKNAAKFGFKI